MDEEELPEPNEYIIPCGIIDVVPCNISLSAFELNRGHELCAETALQTAIEPIKRISDIILCDTVPSLGILTINAIAASNGVLIPVTPQLLSAVGLRLLIKTIQKVQKHINPAVTIEGVLMTMCDTRTNLYKDMSDIMEKTYSQMVRIFNTIIPHSTKVGEANLNCQSILFYDKNSKPAKAYKDFAKELMANG
jgi:chromosome partitioning protein